MLMEMRALLDTWAWSSYASAQLINNLHKKPAKPHKSESRCWAPWQPKPKCRWPWHQLQAIFIMRMTVSKVDKPELTMLENPKYEGLINKYTHLSGVHVDDSDTKPLLPIHLVLRTSEYAKIKTSNSPKIAFSGQPIADKTTLSWTIMLPAHEHEFSYPVNECGLWTVLSLDIPGLAHSSTNYQDAMYFDFKEQLTCHSDGYETSLSWKGSHLTLPTNESVSLKRLQQLQRKLKRSDTYDCATVSGGVVSQETGTTQGLITSKSRLSQKNPTIPRFQLVASHMAVKGPFCFCWHTGNPTQKEINYTRRIYTICK